MSDTHDLTHAGFDTLAVHGAREDLASLGLHVPSIDLSSTSPLPDVESGGDSYENLATGGTLEEGHSAVYQRLWNPTVARMEEAVASLEGTEQAVSFGSGMAALSAVLLACVQEGKPNIVAVRPLYGGTDHVLATGMLGTKVTWATADEVGTSITDETGLIIVESPGNPTLELVDIADVVRQAGDVPVMVDNTFATPVLQRPLEFGATLVMHSATKYLGGHGDVLAGLIATNAEWAAKIRGVRALTGGILHPLSAYLIHRGLQTLPIRVRAQQAGAQVVAEWLTTQEGVEKVYYPGVEGDDQAGLLGRQMSGPGAIVAFDMGSYEEAANIANHTKLITHAVSLGGVDSLIQHPASLTHRPVAPGARPVPGVLRLSVGLEDPKDLIADLERAMQA
ncbi:trans-sulfuration enzyme family protein [Mobilicoccus pelagius]|uniref:homocysteine desulfhydrase n=1 Tax=Mobilicoccus pelagius NBRC 104925 TaxID=1089455 RepID=H5UMG6_9MICO|nr:PLP-dependent aspartate aminotransferase family protein [Mobilicoccus pelagius]GAB46924.1 putative amino acid lyase [Mobilicoccus pelagius NBRC 104925]